MSKKRGLSLEEKRNVILGIYLKRKEPFNLKEIENLASKSGVVLQTVKEVNQSLCDDYLINSDKIGSANFFWSFPSKYSEDLKRKKRSLEAQLTDSVDLEKNFAEARKYRSRVDREAKLQQLMRLQVEEKELDHKILQNKENDPAELQSIQAQVEVNKSAVNRWTDNIYVCKSYLTKKRCLSSKEADKILHIDDNFDYV